MSKTPPQSQFPNRINLGCGRKRLEGYLNVDAVAAVAPDLIHNLDHFPYPLPDGAFEEICASDVVEHLADISGFMREVWRIARPGARVLITTPHFSSPNSYTDPTHRHHLGHGSFDYFTRGHQWNFYGSEGFEIRHRQIIFKPGWTNKVVSRLANRYPARYEERWAWIFPAWFLYFELTVVGK